MLGMHRIPGKRKNADEKCKPIVLWHGLSTDSEFWLAHATRENNLPVLLHDLHYDVWLANNRGNKYSMKHISMKNGSDFWDFSLDEFALYDVPAVIEVRTISLGHSAGSDTRLIVHFGSYRLHQARLCRLQSRDRAMLWCALVTS